MVRLIKKYVRGAFLSVGFAVICFLAGLRTIPAILPCSPQPDSVDNGKLGTNASRSSQNGSVLAKVKEEPGRNQKSACVRHFPSVETPAGIRKVLDAVPVVPLRDVHRIIVITYFRSGSSFVGELFSANTKSFYHFEPLQIFSSHERIREDRLPYALELLDAVLGCDGESAHYYTAWAERHPSLFSRNRFLWKTCRGGQSCFSPPFFSAVCARAPLQVAKIARLHVSQLLRWLDKAENDVTRNLKVLYLVRDPRAILASRRSLDWCRSSRACTHQSTLCSEMKADLDSFAELRRRLPNATFQLRFEDLASEPENATAKLFAKLGLDYSAKVSRYLKHHTNVKGARTPDPYSTLQNTKTVASGWKTKLKPNEVAAIEKSCSDVMVRLGYERTAALGSARASSDTLPKRLPSK